ncbi:MAG TPA: DUF3090 family protein [Actinomycetota bacterium]|nr:DUF3090 family protein [Actinomycetota bacterium]
MGDSFDLGHVDRLTAGAVGEPGQRAFFVQAAAQGRSLTFLVEKEQVTVLARALLQLLASLPDGPEGVEPPASSLDLIEPVEPEWRAGEMSIAYEDEDDRIVIELKEAVEDEFDDDQGVARMFATRAQVRALASHALEVVASGRPRCQLCGSPVVDGEEHFCPSMNGHHPAVEE